MSKYNELYPGFREKILSIEDEMNVWCAKHWPGRKCRMSEGFRTLARQQALYAQGRTKPGKIVTNCDGVRTPSNHQSRLAADLVGVTPEGALTWDCPKAFWDYLGHCARKRGLTWGGDWTKLVDRPHIEHPSSDKTTYAKARVWKP